MNKRMVTAAGVWAVVLLAACADLRAFGAERSADPPSAPPARVSPQPSSSSVPATPSPERALLDRYCVGCHNQRTKSGDLALDAIDVEHVGVQPRTWEKVVRKVRAGMMPPAGRPRPDETRQDQFVSWLSGELNRAFDRQPDPGRTETFHRLNRTEYRNAVRDVLALEINVADFLPADDSSYGFDNIAGVLKLSQSLMERYLSAAKTIARLAVGGPPPALGGATYRVAPDAEQHDRADDLPFGTRGGALVRHLFPQDADYDIKVEVAGSSGLVEEHRLDVTIDGQQVKLFTLGPRGSSGSAYPNEVDGKMTVRVPVAAGPHDVGVAFYGKPSDLVERVREPFPNPLISGNDGGRGGSMPAVTAVTIVGPYDAKGPGDTPSRRRIFDFFKQQVHTAELLKKLMQARGLSTEGHDVDSNVCLDCLQTRSDQARAAVDRDRKMEAEFAAEQRSLGGR
jgi:hypothetical protein